MKFEFRAHRPAAYKEFVLFLLIIIAANLLAVSLLFPELKSINNDVTKSVVLIVPWMILLFLPSIISGIIIYNSFISTYLFTIDSDGISISTLKKKGNNSTKKFFLWTEVSGFRFADFEDNHYFKLHFQNSKHDLILHRDTGEFELFFEELKKYCEAIEAPLF